MIKLRTLFVLGLVATTLTARSEAFPPPEKDEMIISELEARLFDLQGKVVETEFTYVSSFEQVSAGKYRAYCGYYKGGGSLSGAWVSIPPEGKEFFEEMAKKDVWSGSSQTVYLLVGEKNRKLQAIGTRYRKSKNEYSW